MRKYIFALLLILILNFNFAYAAELDLNNLSIQDCLNIALENHPSLRNAKGGVRAAKAQLEQVKANNRVKLNASGSLNYNGNYEEWDDRYHSQSAGLTASKLLYDANKNKIQREIQKLNLTSSREGERERRVSVAASAKRAYYDLVLKILNRDVELEKLKNLEEHVERAKGYYEVGNSAYIDVTKAEADAASARTSLLKAENDILLSQENLLVAMGINDNSINNLNLALSSKLLIPENNKELKDLLGAALEDRPDLKQANNTVKSRELSIKNAARGDAPTVTGQLTSNFAHREGQSSTENYGANININIPVVDGGAVKADVELARAQLEQSQADRDLLKQQITYGVRSAALSLANAIERAKSSQSSVQYAEENLELARGRYEVGVGTPLELSDAVSSLAQARYTHYQALYDAQSARADLDEAMGHLPIELE